MKKKKKNSSVNVLNSYGTCELFLVIQVESLAYFMHNNNNFLLSFQGKVVYLSWGQSCKQPICGKSGFCPAVSSLFVHSTKKWTWGQILTEGLIYYLKHKGTSVRQLTMKEPRIRDSRLRQTGRRISMQLKLSTAAGALAQGSAD